jgi:ABC-2 type transport system permease protein
MTNPYLAFLSTRWRSRIQYRAAAFAGVVTQFFWGFIKIMILEAFYRSAPAAMPMSFTEAVAYVWLGQAFLALLPWNLDSDIVALIRDGTVSYELLRPIDLYAIWYLRTLAWRVANALLRCIPLLLFAAIVLPLVGLDSWALPLPPSLPAGFAWLASMVVATLLGAAITTIAHTSLFWTVSGQGMSTLLPGVVTIFSGMVIPLPLFPDRMQLFFRLLPFHALLDSPFRIYSGNITGGEVVSVFIQQIIWLAVSVVLGRRLMERGRRMLVVQGG